MNNAVFWHLIARLGHDLQPCRLAMALASLSVNQFHAFGWNLRRAASELDSPAHRLFASDAREHLLPAPGRVGEPVVSRGRASSLREVQTTVVAMGHDVWSTVVTTPALLDASWPCDLGRQVEALALERHRQPIAVLGA